MSKPNLINGVLRDQLIKLSLESMGESESPETLNKEQKLTKSVEEYSTLVTIRSDLRIAKGINRAQALVLESLDSVTLPFSARGFSLDPSRTGLKLTQEAIDEAINEQHATIYRILTEVWTSLREQLFGTNARVEQAKDDLRTVRSDLKQDSLGRVGSAKARLLELAYNDSVYKGICKDLLQVCSNLRLSSVVSSNTDFTEELETTFELRQLKALAVRHGRILCAPNAVIPNVIDVRVLVSKALSLKPSTDNNLDELFDRAMSTLGVIESALNTFYEFSKETRQTLIQLSLAGVATPEYANNLTQIWKLSSVCAYLVCTLNSALIKPTDHKE